MTDRWRWIGALAAVLGGVLAIGSSIPPAWYGVGSTDSYVFAPPLFSPIWIDRTLMPVLFLGAISGLLLGLGGLVYRDWTTNRTHRVGGTLAVLGGASIGVGLYGPDLVTPGGIPVGPVAGLIGFALLAWGAILVLVGGPLLASSYLRAGRRLLGSTILGIVPAMLLLGYLFPGPLGEFGGSIPLFVLGVVIARDLGFRERVGRDVGDV